MSDIIAVMRSGHIEQIGSPWEIYFRPANRFVADFVGTVNFLTARIVSAEGGTVAADHNGMILQIPTEVPVESVWRNPGSLCRKGRVWKVRSKITAFWAA